MTEPAAEQDYYLEIEAHFAARRGTPFILSPKDWMLMKKWKGNDIPLPVIIEAIDQVFARNEESGRKKVISSLHYCRHAVKEIWEERRQLHVGQEDLVPEEDPAQALEIVAAAIEKSRLPMELSAALSAEVRALTALRSVPKIEERLIEMEQELFARLLTELSAEERSALQIAISKSLGDPTNLDEKTRRRTEDANQRRQLRARFELPRLTLFR